MKTRLLIITVFVIALIPVTAKSFAEGSFNGYSSIDPPLSEVTAGQQTEMNIRFSYTSGPYALNNFTPVIEVNPSSANQFVKVKVDPLEITQGQIKRIPVTLTVDSHIEHEKIFLSISYTGYHFQSGELHKSSWNDQIELDVKGALVPEPEPDKPIPENCPPDTTLQDGICVVDKSHKPPSDSAAKWGTGLNFGSSWQSNQSNRVSIYDDFFSINEKQVRYNVFYNVTNASISNVQLNCDSSSFSFSIMPDDEGVLHLDIPKGLLGGIFMVQVNGQEWDDVSLDGNVLTINFPAYEAAVKVLGTYHLNEEKNDGVCDVIHDPPYSYILSPLKQFASGVPLDQIHCKQDLHLMLKPTEFSIPVCVTQSTYYELANRGWSVVLPFTGD